MSFRNHLVLIINPPIALEEFTNCFKNIDYTLRIFKDELGLGLTNVFRTEEHLIISNSLVIRYENRPIECNYRIFLNSKREVICLDLFGDGYDFYDDMSDDDIVVSLLNKLDIKPKVIRYTPHTSENPIPVIIKKYWHDREWEEISYEAF